METPATYESTCPTPQAGMEHLRVHSKRGRKKRVEITRTVEEVIRDLKRLDRLERENKVFLFKPHVKQEGFFDALHNPEKKVLIFQGGNRSGKTTSLIVAIISLMLGETPWDKKRLRYKTPVKGRLFGEDWTHHVGQVLVPKLKEWVPKTAIKNTKKNNQGVEYYWEFVNGSTLEIMTYEQSTDSVEGWSGHFVACDEPMPRDKYIANKRGLVDYGGVFLMSFTPLKEPWIKDDLIDNPDPTIAAYFVDTMDNPYLSVAEIEDFKNSLTDDEKAVRLQGQWMHLQGLVYKEFDKNIHWIEPFRLTDAFTVYAAIDTHPRTEQAVTFLATDKRGLHYVVGERFQHGRPEDVADWIIEFHDKTHKTPGTYRPIEPGRSEPRRLYL